MHAINKHHICNTKTKSTHMSNKPNVFLHAHRIEHRMIRCVFMTKQKQERKNMTPTVTWPKNKHEIMVLLINQPASICLFFTLIILAKYL